MRALSCLLPAEYMERLQRTKSITLEGPLWEWVRTAWWYWRAGWVKAVSQVLRTLCRSKALGGPVYAPCWLSPDWHFMGGRHTLPGDSGLEKGAGSQYSQGVKAARSTSRVQVAHS